LTAGGGAVTSPVMSVTESGAVQRRLYGRRRGRALRPGQRHLIETLLPALRVDLPREGALDPVRLFAAPVAAVWLELGFGGGEHLAAQAALHPSIGMIGAEVFENGVAKLLAEIERRALANIRLFVDDGRLLLAALPERALARVFVLFPDPWPKARHAKRRLVAAETLDALARVMADGAELRLATDDMDYARAMLALGTTHAEFRWCAARADDWRERPPDWPPTRYEEKALAAGRRPLYLRFTRLARAR
jgi:tRNA (guanine-N7-)-methyltransferase